MGFSGGSDGKASACNVGDLGSIPRLERSPGEENGNPLQYSCMENSMDRGAWQAIVHGVAKSQTRLSNFTSSLLQTIIVIYLNQLYSFFSLPKSTCVKNYVKHICLNWYFLT